MIEREPLDRDRRRAELLADERVLAQLAVDVRLDPDGLPVGQLVPRDDARPHRAERVEVLAEVACPLWNCTEREPTSLKTV